MTHRSPRASRRSRCESASVVARPSDVPRWLDDDEQVAGARHRARGGVYARASRRALRKYREEGRG